MRTASPALRVRDEIIDTRSSSAPITRLARSSLSVCAQQRREHSPLGCLLYTSPSPRDAHES
eukprot:2081158-Prymnesium_polylepis.1